MPKKKKKSMIKSGYSAKNRIIFSESNIKNHPEFYKKLNNGKN